MSWLSVIFNRIFPGKPAGLVLEGADAWLLESDVDEKTGRDFAPLLSHAVELFGPGAVLYLEGNSIAPDIRALLEKHRAPQTSTITPATAWPRPETLHVSLANDLAEPLAALCRGRPARDLCDHLHVYANGRLLLQGFDAGGDPLLVSATIPESAVAAFCEKTGYAYRREASA